MKAFSHDLESAYDMNNYAGRLKHFQKLINPVNLSYSDEQLLQFKENLLQHKNNNKELTDAELWKMKYLIWSNLHSDTQELLPKVTRLSGFVPANIPIIILISILPQTPLIVVFGQSLNQTYNFAFNYANRNASNSFTNGQFLGSYCGAVGCAVGVSLGLPRLVQRLPLPNKIKTVLTTISPFAGIITANLFNLLFSRFKDFSNGINIQGIKQNGDKFNIQEKSVIAAQTAFIYTAIIRCTLPIPVFGAPILALNFMKSMNIYPKQMIGQLFANTLISGATLYFALSACISMFPQNIEVNKEQLESKFQQMKDTDGNIIQKFVFNKGL